MKALRLLSVLALFFLGCASDCNQPLIRQSLPQRILGNPFRLSSSGVAKVSELYGKSALILEPKELAGWGITLNLSERLFDGTRVNFEIRFHRETHHLWIRIFAETESEVNTPFPILPDGKSLLLLKNKGEVFVHRDLPNVDIWSVIPDVSPADLEGERISVVLVLSKGELVLNQSVRYDVNYRTGPVNKKMSSVITVTLQTIGSNPPQAVSPVSKTKGT